MHHPVHGPDHPRSRGVYFGLDPDSPVTGGSSPLARGLLPEAGVTGNGNGIIPARAGFTIVSSFRFALTGDHPRSRGVYTNPDAASAAASGSSPLARGLPPRKPSHGGSKGIIPARAGFTLTASLSLPQVVDHPRSRGVYPAVPRSHARVPGSSPLARGLHHLRRHRLLLRRIIPARAGFTII